MKTMLGLLQSSTRFDANLSEWGGSLLSLAIRFFVGAQFLRSGLNKLNDWSVTLALFQDEYKVPLLSPEFAAVLGTASELIFPILLFVGLVSRPAALALFFVNIIAVISYPKLFALECAAAINDHFYWGALLLVLMAFGPGRFSLDYALTQRR